MAKVVFAWELGGGIGHLMRIVPIAKALRDARHQVLLITRDVPAASKFMRPIGVPCIQAPIHQSPPFKKLTLNFAHVLESVGYGDSEGLRALASAWRTTFRLIQPDLLVCDHAPTAMLAARGLDIRCAVIGSGFCIPPDVSPMPTFDVPKAPATSSHKDEQRILANINHVLASWSLPLLKRVGQIYSDADEQFLTTYRELDHYSDRPGAPIYWGPVNSAKTGRKQPEWPEGRGPSIYAYLKPFPALESLLIYLRTSEMPVLIYNRDIPISIRRKYASNTIRFEGELLNLDVVSDQCQLAITHGTLGTTSYFLGKGKPVLAIPLVLEQMLIANRIGSLGVGIPGSATDGPKLTQALQQVVLNLSKYTDFAQSFAGKLKCEADIAQTTTMMNQRICSLASLPTKCGTVQPDESKGNSSPTSSAGITTLEIEAPTRQSRLAKEDSLAAPRVVLAIRRSKTYWLDSKIDPSDVLNGTEIDQANASIKWWNRTLRVSYQDFRRQIQALAATSHEQARFDEIIPWTDIDTIQKQLPGTWIVPIDEDDWIDPSLADVLRLAVRVKNAKVAVWDVVRREADGRAALNPNPFIESCGYAVRLPFPMAAIQDHMELGPSDAVRSEAWCIPIEQILSIRNQTPGSLGFLATESVAQIVESIALSRNRLSDDLPPPFLRYLQSYRKILDSL
ncbi:MAG: hypothetical protein QM754_07850 [Tepidisphaeraceae bacterium]